MICFAVHSVQHAAVSQHICMQCLLQAHWQVVNAAYRCDEGLRVQCTLVISTFDITILQYKVQVPSVCYCPNTSYYNN